MTKNSPGKLQVRQKVSVIGRPHPQRRIVEGLGLRGPGSVVVVDNTPSFRGMVKKVIHLVEVQEQDGSRSHPATGSKQP